jgi:hypothetical protein
MIAPVLEAVAIEARCCLRWGWEGFNDETRRIKAKNVHYVSIPYLERDSIQAQLDAGFFPMPYGPKYGKEDIELETLWVGMHRYMRIGYGPHINVLAVVGERGL